MPVVGYCQDCRVFVCRTCAELGRVPSPLDDRHPVRCTDCQLLHIRSQRTKLRRRMQRALGMGIFTLLIAEYLFNRIAFGSGAMLAGLIVGYVIGSLFLGGWAGPFSAPWLVIQDFRILDRLQQRQGLVLQVQQRHNNEVHATYQPQPSAIPPAGPGSSAPNPPSNSGGTTQDDEEFDPNTPTYL